ncbi:MAG: hypothetical protein PW792_00725 [Acidobacteriaceae bacterium]|nr:hypothetical protein [Acidobacteriaceae bacterium]
MKPNHSRPWLPCVAAFASALSLLALTGCGVSGSLADNSVTPITLQGQVFAGRNYMAGATVKIYATQPTGVATNGTYVGKAKLLQTITANTTGTWSTQGVSCSSPDQLYVTAEAGTPYPSNNTGTTLANNPNSLMMTAIGDCSILGAASGTRNVTSIVTNEASTVAAVWALRPFISLDGTTVNITSSAMNYAGTNGVGTTANFAGLTHAFLNANNLNPYKLGAFNQYTNQQDSSTTGGLVPVQELNSLAYAQYLCTIGTADATDTSFPLCQQLYTLATPPGGTAPKNSLQAMLNIATEPANNAADILTFTLTPAPFGTATSSQPISTGGVYVPALTSLGTLTNDWSVAIYYLPGYAGTATGQASVTPEYVALDANDDVFFSNPNASTGVQGNIVALTSAGVPYWTSDTDTTLTQPRQLQVDTLGNLWVANGGSGSTAFVQQMNASTGELLNRYPSTVSAPYALAVDTAGNVWYSTQTTSGQNLFEIQRSGSTFAAATLDPAPGMAYQPFQIRPDTNGNIWAAGYSSATGAAMLLPNTGTAAAPTYTTTAKLFQMTADSFGGGITIDSANNAYTNANGTGNAFYQLSVTGSGSSAAITSTPLAVNAATLAVMMDTDGAGNVWYADHTTGTDFYKYSPVDNSITSFYPCYVVATITSSGYQTCVTGISTRWDFSIDSSGAMWVASYGNSGGGRIAQILGLAAPTVPLRALGKAGIMP